MAQLSFHTMTHPTGTLWNSEKNAYVRATQQVNNTATDITSSHLRTEIFALNFTKLQHVWGKQDKTNQAYSRRGDTHLKLQYLQGTSRRITTSQGKPGLHREILLQNKTKFIKGQSKSYTEKGTGHTSVILVFGSLRKEDLLSSMLEPESWLSG